MPRWTSLADRIKARTSSAVRPICNILPDVVVEPHDGADRRLWIAGRRTASGTRKHRTHAQSARRDATAGDCPGFG